MPEIFINGEAVEARDGQTVLEVALASGHYIPHLCWHKELSVAGNCRLCIVQVEGRSWTEIACNLPITPGMRVETDSELVREQRKATMQFITLNHPVDCGICDKAGECTLQDYHYAYNGSSSISIEQKVRNTKLHELSSRILLDNERCVVCTRCVRFTEEVSGSNALGVLSRGDESTVRASADGAFEHDHYSDNVIDICPVGALLSRDFLHKVRVWYLQATPSVCPGCERGCSIDLWHRKPEWHVRSLDRTQNTAIARVTPRDNPAVNGPWICNTGRDIARILERTRAVGPMLKGRAVEHAEAVAEARRLIGAAKRPVALVSSWASNEELAAFSAHLAARFGVAVKVDRLPEAGEPVEDALLIRADKNPNIAGARAVFEAVDAGIAEDTDLVLVWGEGCDFTRLPRQAKTIYLNAWLDHANGWADVFFATSIQTERSGHYTNFEGTVSAFSACFPKRAGAVDAEALFAELGAGLPA
jgi:NADH-quinone oxidoreductase subunit G